MSIFNPKRRIAICLALLLLATACASRAETFSEQPAPPDAESAFEEAALPPSSKAPLPDEEPAEEPLSLEESEAPAEPSSEEEPPAGPAPQESEPESVAASASEQSSEASSEEPAPESSVEEPASEPITVVVSEEPEPEPVSEAVSEEEPAESPAPLQPIEPPVIIVEEEEETEEPAEPLQPAAPASQAYTSVIIDGLTYINGIPIVNKTYSVPREYAPGVNPTAYAAFETMRDAAAQEGINLFIISGYRSYDHQANTYQRYCNRDGQAAADRYSARPGHSEHQTGLCFDLNSLLFSFGDTAEGKWLAAHCAEYGFIIRYPIDGESSTGYRYEPWHVRYLGAELAQSVTASGLTLEDYLGITSVYAE